LPIREGLKFSAAALRQKGYALVRLGPVEDGLIAIESSEERGKVQWGEQAAATLLPNQRIVAMLELGNLDDAQHLLDRTSRLLEGEQSEASTASRPYWQYRVSLLTAQHKTLDARAVLESSRALLSPPGAGLAEVAMVDWLDAAVEQQEGKHTRAKDRLQLALAQIAKSPDRLWLREWEAKLQESLGVSLLALGDTAAAQHSLEQALELYKQVLDPKTSLHVGRVALRLANLHKQAGRASLAKPLQAQSDAIRRKHPMFERWLL
jgi:tetratricopeptide (TPR) repeat protein